MNEEILPQRILERSPHGRKMQGRPRNSWIQEVTTNMRRKGIVSIGWMDREEWRKK